MNKQRFLFHGTFLMAVAVACVLSGCPKKPEPPPLTPEKATEVRNAVVAWLECEECTEGQLDAVVKLGEVAVPSLVASLREGPSPAGREGVQRHLMQTYKDLKAYAATHPEADVKMSEDEYVKMYMDNYVALYQTRAAEALGTIGGDAARDALNEAGKTATREDVKRTVGEALGKLK